MQVAADGTVADALVVDGPVELRSGTMASVAWWLHRPTLLNGEPVEVATTVDVNFALAQ